VVEKPQTYLRYGLLSILLTKSALVGIFSICWTRKALKIASGLYPVGPLLDLGFIFSTTGLRSIGSKIQINLSVSDKLSNSSKGKRHSCRILLIGLHLLSSFLGVTIKFDKNGVKPFLYH